jgi:hypothetical protein
LDHSYVVRKPLSRMRIWSQFFRHLEEVNELQNPL